MYASSHIITVIACQYHVRLFEVLCLFAATASVVEEQPLHGMAAYLLPILPLPVVCMALAVAGREVEEPLRDGGPSEASDASPSSRFLKPVSVSSQIC